MLIRLPPCGLMSHGELVLTMTLVAIVGPHGPPAGQLAAIMAGIGFFTGLAPYALADSVLDRWRRAATRKAG
jgi:hypothetical protein